MATIAAVHDGKVALGEYEFRGWIKTHRRSKKVAFIELTDGSSIRGLQVVINPELPAYVSVSSDITTGASLTVRGNLVQSPGAGQSFELQASDLTVCGPADAESYPLQKKGHSLEFLREHLHLRPRSNTLGAVFRVRSRSAFAIHSFFQSRNFLYLQSPIITTSDCEGAGEMFRVTTLNLNDIPTVDGKVNFDEDFFRAEASLTVSGQLEAEAFAHSHMNCYTFGPTFRSENSNTTRHLAEFWMIEPEMAFCDLEGNMALGKEFVKAMIQDALEHNAEDLKFLSAREWVDYNLLETLHSVVEKDVAVLSYSEAITVLEKSKKSFEFPVHWGIDLQAEHERYLTDEYVNGPVYVINYPKEIKAFYMRLNDDEKTVAAMDLLVPRLGEIIGGSQREERLPVLKARMTEMGLDPESYDWYLDLRRFGGTKHAGFGLGFERLLMYITGMTNIRDVIPFPRFPGYARF